MRPLTWAPKSVPNHSVERTCPGEPGHAAHVEREVHDEEE